MFKTLLIFLGVFAVSGFSGLAATDGPTGSATAEPLPRIILSTDVAIGLIDTNGGSSLIPVPFDADHPYSRDANVIPQDFDDGLTLAAALNMDAAGLLELTAVVPTYGNASLPAEMLVARKIIEDLKGRSDIPLANGAILPAGQILNPTATWFDGDMVKVTGRNGTFAAACGSPGVDLMIDVLKGASRAGPVTILAIGPLTDIACLLETAPKAALSNIREIIFLASQMEGERVFINGIPINDFNLRIDPLAGALVLASNRVAVPMRFMTFRLSRQTSLAGQDFAFNRKTYPGPQPPTQAGKASFNWLLKASKLARAAFVDAFGSSEGPFDQYTLAAALKPDLFKCEDGYAYIQMCPYPAWSRKYPTDDDGNPTQEPYNAPDNPCTSHGTEYGEELSTVPAQLMITTKKSRRGALIRGKSGIDGNLPQFSDRKGRKVTVCLDFAQKDSRTAFEDLLKRWVW